MVEKRRLQNINKCADVLSTRTRQRCTSYSDTDEDKTAQHIGSYTTDGRRTSRHRLHLLLRHGHRIRHGGTLNTGTILNSGESGNQKNGTTKGGGRHGERRQQTIHVHTSIRKLIVDDYGSTVAQVALSSQISLQYCTFMSHVVVF